MKQQATIIPFPATSAVYLAGHLVSNLIHDLPAGTGYFLGVVLLAMMTGHLAQQKGSLARAVFPFVAHLKWGWHRAERVMARGKFCLDGLCDRAWEWSLTHLEAQPARLGVAGREVQVIDSSTIARFRAGPKWGAAGKGYWGRANRAVKAHIVAALSSVVFINGLRVGLVRRARFGASCEAAVAALCGALPPCLGKRLPVVDAGIATTEQFAAATQENALLGRLRCNARLRLKPGLRCGLRGRKPKHGAVFPPGADFIEIDPDESYWEEVEERGLRIRRWNEVHYEEQAGQVLDVVRVDDPKYKRPLIIGSTARELTTAEIIAGYGMRTSIETNFYVGQDSCAMEQPRAFAEESVKRRGSV